MGDPSEGARQEVCGCGLVESNLKQLYQPQEVLLCWYWLAGEEETLGRKQTYCQGHQWQGASPTKGTTQDHILEALGARTAGLDPDKGSAFRQAVVPG